MTTSTTPPRPKPTSPTGPKPSGPTHPKPTAPPPRGGHLPIDVVPSYPLPRLGEVIRDAERLLAQAISLLERQWDPTSGPQQDGGVLPSTVDMLLGAARTEICVALLHLGDVADMSLPPAGSAVAFRRVPALDPPAPHAGEGRSPDLVAVAAAPVAAAVGVSPGASPGSRAGASSRPVWPGTDEIAASINTALARRSR